MRVILDTNVVVSSFLWSGPPNEILILASKGAFDLFSTERLLLELSDVLTRKKLRHRLKETGYTPGLIMEKYRKLLHLVTPVEFLEPPPVRDIDDVAVLSAAFAARAGFIVTGDDDLLELKRFDTIRIVTSAQFLIVNNFNS